MTEPTGYVSGNIIPRIHFCGILGVSMLKLALYCKSCGYRVSGSDISMREDGVDRLRAQGIEVFLGHSSKNVLGADMVIYSHAVSADNCEIAEAKRLKIPIFSRSQLLGGILMNYKNRIGVCGTHGKSTVSSMLECIFLCSGASVGAFIGVENDKRMCGGESSEWVIYEACEYKKAFLDTFPTVCAVLNMELEHTDVYPSLESYIEAFRIFAQRAEVAVLNADCKNCFKITPYLKKCKFYSVGDKRCQLYARDIEEELGRYSFTAVYEGKSLFRVRLKVAGEHNLSNALAAILCAICAKVPCEYIKRGLESFSGIKRRLQLVGMCGESAVYDDYAHHPTEILSTLSALRKMGYKKVVCAFQPHTYSRTKAFFDEFAQVFARFDRVIFADVFAAREARECGAGSDQLSRAVKGSEYQPDIDRLCCKLRSLASKDTVIVTMGAGMLDEVARKIVQNNNDLQLSP